MLNYANAGATSLFTTVEDLAAEVTKAANARGKALYDLGRWCDRKDLPGWGALFRARSIQVRPSDARTRKELGFKRDEVASLGKRLDGRAK